MFISRPDDDEHMPPLDNALQLLPGPGHQFTLQEANDFNFSLPTESYYDGFYPMIDSVYLVSRNSLPTSSNSSYYFKHRTDRPRLTQVSTAVPHREMFHCGSSKADEATSLRPPEWSYTSERFTDLGSPTVAQSCISPASQGFSPLTPLTPLLSMGPSPTNSTFPSPGSQGNPISPSPQVTFAVSLPTVDDPARSLHHYGTSSQYLGGQTSAASYQPSTGNAAYGAANFSRRGHSHSVGGPMRQPAYFLAGPSTSSSPYARPSPKPSVGQLSCNRPRTVTAVDTQSYLYLGQTIPGPVVKQSVYRPISQSDQRRYVNDIKLLDPILFYQRNPQELGINLDDLMKNRLARLEGREEHMFEGQGPSISIRIVVCFFICVTLHVY